jgi:bis(5'-nucleosyl)-tetraphosphatase (symmetrical)
MEPFGHMKALPAIWMIGDVQGCNEPLQRLLAHPEIASDPQAQFWFAGDIINRGPDSLGALRTVISLGERATVVLGNHDLHLLAVAAGVRKAGKSDTLNDILDAPDSQELIDWLRHCPLAHFEHQHLMVHAGVLAKWSVQKTLELASEVQDALRGPNWQTMLSNIFGNEPTHWKDKFDGCKRLRVIVNALTRMRMCTLAGHMEFGHKGAPGNEPDLLPWFDVPGRVARGTTIVFGHWSTLGLMLRPDAICLDTGCVWGRHLTALRLHDHRLIQVPAVPAKANFGV